MIAYPDLIRSRVTAQLMVDGLPFDSVRSDGDTVTIMLPRIPAQTHMSDFPGTGATCDQEPYSDMRFMTDRIAILGKDLAHRIYGVGPIGQ